MILFKISNSNHHCTVPEKKHFPGQSHIKNARVINQIMYFLGQNHVKIHMWSLKSIGWAV